VYHNSSFIYVASSFLCVCVLLLISMSRKKLLKYFGLICDASYCL
jgi:hypothetical protein